jgi:hypothetical protein
MYKDPAFNHANGVTGRRRFSVFVEVTDLFYCSQAFQRTLPEPALMKIRVRLKRFLGALAILPKRTF